MITYIDYNQQKKKSMSFQDLNLHDSIHKVLKELKYAQPTPIQSQAIPMIMNGADLRATAQTGTGKTAAFILPALNRLTVASPVPGKGPRILVLVPTRELAMQVAAAATQYSKYVSRCKTICIYGGAPYPVQNRQLAGHYDIIVATPGRLIDHMEQGRINFSRIEMLILDEADRMLDMGFIDPVKEIAAALPKNRQTLMFSATLKGSVIKLSNHLLNNPLEISVTPEKVNHENIDQRLHFVDDMNHKRRLLDHFLEDPNVNQAIVFTSTKHYADQLLRELLVGGYDAAALHGDMNQRQRTRTIAQLREGSIKILVATDVAARGIDVQNITHVINFDFPTNSEDYVHRIGRTGRAGAKGLAVTFASHRDMQSIRRLEEYTGEKLVTHVIPGMEPKGKPQGRPVQKKKGFFQRKRRSY